MCGIHISTCHGLGLATGQLFHLWISVCGAGLDCVFISSSHAVVIIVHNGVRCCPIAPACCPIWDLITTCASPATLPSLCHPSQMLGHLYLPYATGSRHCSVMRTCCSGAAESTSSARELIPLLTMVPFLTISSTTWLTFSTDTHHLNVGSVANGSHCGGHQSASQHVWHAMGLGVITDGHPTQSSMLDSGLHALHSTVLSAVARLHSGLSGRTISRPSHVQTFVQLQQESGTLSAKGTPGMTKLIVSTGLSWFRESLPGKRFWHNGASILSLLGHSLQVGFDEAFHELTVNRFVELCELPCHQGVFDAPFTSSELRRALSRCAKSAVGADGLPY